MTAAMSGPHHKLPASNITCRYWATSGTCFFGDQCNFAHTTSDHSTSGRTVPKREKACKELLLTGYCKNEDKGCEYNHDITNVTRSGPPASTVPGLPNSSSASSWTASASRTNAGTSGVSGTASVAGIRNKVLPVSAPAFVPAAVAAAQRAALTAWGGVTPGGGKLLNSVGAQPSFGSAPNSGSGIVLQNGSTSSASPAATNTSSAAAQVSPLRTSEVEHDTSGTSLVQDLGTVGPPSRPTAQPLSPANTVVSSAAANGSTSTSISSTASSGIKNANAAPYVPSAAVASAVGAAPYVPKSKQQQLAGVGGLVGPGAGLGFGTVGGRPLPMGHSHGGTQQLQIRQQLSQLQQQMQQQAAVHMLAAARGITGNGMSSPYLNMEVPMVMPPFRLPDGDDPALGMTAMSPPNHAFAIPLPRAGNGGMPVLPSPEALASMSMVGDTGGLHTGNGFGSPLSFGPNFQAQSLRSQQQQQQQIQQLQKLQSQHHGPLQLQGQVHPYSLRSPQKMDGQKQFGQTPEKSMSSSVTMDSSAVNDGRSLSPNIFSGDLQAKDHAGSAAEQEQQHQSLREASLQQQQQHQPHSQHQQHPQQTSQQQPNLKQQRQQQMQKLHHHQQIHILQQRPQAPQGPLTSSVQQQMRLPAGYFRSMSPASMVAPVAAATHGGATYFLGPGQGIGSLQHVVSTGPYSGSVLRADGRAARGHSPVGRAHLGSRFLPEHLREELRRRHALIHAQLDPEQDLVDLPDMVQRFHSLYPLEDVSKEDEPPSSSFGVRTMIFKGISSSDGQAYAIRRIDSRQVALIGHKVIPTAELATAAVEAVERWSPLSRHPHIVAIREAFVSREIEDSAALFFVHDYYPAAVTLESLHLPQEQPGGVVHLTVSEEQLWSYVVQLATVIRSVHAAGLFFRPGGLHPSKVLLPSKGRLRVNAVGILDVLNGDPADDIHVMQREDFAGFGRLILCMACASAVNPSMEFMAAHYSADLVRVTEALLASSPEKAEGLGINSIRQLYAVLAEHLFGEIEHVHVQNDELMAELGKETENGRLLRILIKLGMMNERPEDDIDPSWSETGDRYLLKLFRDFVFHQMTDEGAPIIDWGHVIESLNKLDAGVSEKLILLSRDERSMLIASYADLKRCLEGAYQELIARASGDKPRASLSQSAMSVAQSPFGHSSRANQRQTS